MKGSNIIQAFQHLRMSKEFLQDFQREFPGTKGASLFANYERKIDWIYTDLITNPNFPPDVVAGLKEEWNCDMLSLVEIHDKISLLKPHQRNTLEELLDLILKGETIDVCLRADEVENLKL